ncbi:MAG: aryl-sulfate sulfotransferase [Proteobacteria bacterium]|nr:aryl-sulfate sulfotransferase [Pseudomonadota bacterium]
MRPYTFVAPFLVAFLLQGCFDDSKSSAPIVASVASTSDIAVTGQRAGSTPFVAFVDLAGSSTGSVTTIRYMISPLTGTASAPVRVSYTMTNLRNRGYVTRTGVTVPVFGLYANATNTASVTLTFSDSSTQVLSVPIATPPYTATSALKTPAIDQPRTPGSVLGFDFFAIKPASQPAPVTVMDTDGNIRWVSTTPAKEAIQYTKDGFVIGDIAGKSLSTEGWDGKVTTVSLADQSFIGFHHDIGIGPAGYLIAPSSVGRPGDFLVEIRPDGTTAKTFDLLQIFSDFMRANGDDPSVFARAGFDWFHLNSAIYDPSDRSVIVSSRENFIVKIDYDTAAIKWIFGDETKYWYTFASLRSKAVTLAPGGLVPVGQHALMLQPDGQLLMFNNGNGSLQNPPGTSPGLTRSYSAITGFFIDGPRLAATPGLTMDDGQTIYSPICSSAYPSADRSMLVTYSSTASGLRIKGFDPQWRTVFDMHFSGGCSTGWNSVIVPLQDLTFGD